MALHRQWIRAGAVVTLAMLTGPVLAFAGSNSAYRPPVQTPPVRQQFNTAATPPVTPKFNKASGATTQSGKPNTATSSQTGPKPAAQNQAGPKPAAPTQQQMIEAFRANMKDLTAPRNPRSNVQNPRGNVQTATGARGVHNSQESRVPDPNARNPRNPRQTPNTWTGPGGPR